LSHGKLLIAPKAKIFEKYLPTKKFSKKLFIPERKKYLTPQKKPTP